MEKISQGLLKWIVTTNLQTRKRVDDIEADISEIDEHISEIENKVIQLIKAKQEDLRIKPIPINEPTKQDLDDSFKDQIISQIAFVQRTT